MIVQVVMVVVDGMSVVGSPDRPEGEMAKAEVSKIGRLSEYAAGLFADGP
jgi:hypothetical protein